MEAPKQKKLVGSSTSCKRKDNNEPPNISKKKRSVRRITFENDKLSGRKPISYNSDADIDDDEDEDEDEDESQIDLSIELKLQECAKRNNLSPMKMKKILRKLVGNDHVLALVKLQEESENAKEKAEKKNIENSKKTKDVNNSSRFSEIDSSPKLTRSKVKALNQKVISLPPLIDSDLEPEMVAFISSELHSDSEGDDEYEPREEDVASEDDLNTTASDLDSQPRTPATPASQNDFLSPVRYDNDGVFKVPRERNDSLSQEEIIAKRTRSKLCLQTTPIESIESTFIPPDITPDMYDLDKEVDENWMDFLTSFALNQNTPQEDDDPDADPEYVAAEKVTLDAEELRDVNISKKELNDLVSELFDGFVGEGCGLGDEIHDLETPKKIIERTSLSPRAKSPNKRRNLKSTVSDQNSEPCQLENPIQTNILQSQSNIHMSPPVNLEYYNINNNTNLGNDSTLTASYNETSFVPNVNSTPQQPYQRPNSFFSTQPPQQGISQVEPTQNPQVPWIPVHQNRNSSQCCNHNKQVDTYFTINPLNSIMAYPVPDSKTRCYQIARIPNQCKNSTNLPKTQPILAQLQNNSKPVAYVDLTKSPTSKESKKINFIEHPDFYELWNGDAHVSAVKYFKIFYEDKYKAMEDERPKEPAKFDQNIGFTNEQISLLKQQMQVHVQFAAQNYLQCYSHPQFWRLAKAEKDMLLELQKSSKGNINSNFNAWNLQKAITLIHEWENELSVDNEENQAFMEFILRQIKRSKTSRYHYNRIISFPPRTMQRILSSQVFMYPEYLPRLPFRTNYETAYHDIIPIESHMVAFGLEKYMTEILNDINENKHHYNKKYSLIKLAISRICENLITGKTKARIYNYYKQQLNEDVNFNPIKYYDIHKCAPPFENILLPLDHRNILPPEKRISDLPAVWKNFCREINYKRSLKSYTNYVPVELNWSKEKSEKNRRGEKQKSNSLGTSDLTEENATEKLSQTNVVIHVNYIFDNTVSNSSQTSALNISPVSELESSLRKTITPIALNQTNAAPSLVSVESAASSTATHNNSDADCLLEFNNSPTLIENIPPKIERRNSTTDYTQIFTKIHDSLGIRPDHFYENQPLSFPDDNKSLIGNQNSLDAEISSNSYKHQKLLTDYFPSSKKTYNFTSHINKVQSLLTSRALKLIRVKYQKHKRKKKTTAYSASKRIYSRNSYIGRPYLVLAKKFKNRKKLKLKLQNSLKRLWKYLHKFYNLYKNKHLNIVFVKFKSLELYTQFLNELKMNCNVKRTGNGKTEGEFISTSSTSSALSLMNKKIRNLDQDDAAKLKKANRLGETLKHMLLPDSKEEANKKDAIYAYNYYERVEETLLSSNDANKFKRFQAILKSFDPQKDKVADLYYSIETLFLPDYPDLAQVFLTFLLPSEAVEIGKFFEHFIVTNMGTFVQKLNVYFNKQPAQIRKIYNCLNELADDNDVTMDKIKSKILPLLKGNQFLIDWFLQNFPEEKPPESLMTVSESMNFKEVEANLDGNICEIVPTKDLIDDTTDNQSCQLKYINGRLFYGSRILLPAKLAFMAKNLAHTDEIDEDRLKTTQFNANSCVHGIKELGEKRLKANQLDHSSSCDENEKSEEEDNVDSTEKSVELCDEATFRLHAARLNPNLYGTYDAFTIFNNSVSNKTKDEGKTSPRKYLNRFNYPSFKISNLSKEKGRKSPKKSTPKSPNSNLAIKRSPPAETSNAINTAKKLKAMTEETDETKTKKKILSNKTQQQSKCLSENFLDDETKKTENILQNEDSIHVINNKATEEIKPWTRDEDKIILEEVKTGFNSKGNLIKRIHEKLSYRKINEIMERHKFLMDVLCKLKNRN